MDRYKLNRSPVSACCLGILRRAHEHIRNTLSAKWYDPALSRPTVEQVKRLADILRGDFEFFVSPGVAAEEAEQEIHRFTEEQFPALDVLEENDRIVYKGPAGTGKTFLAIEAARRSLLAGRRTLFVCYNRLLGLWLTRRIEALSEQHPELLTAGTLHSVLLRLSGLRPPEGNDPDFWSKRVPDSVVERALIGIIGAPLYDTLILDEAQDLITEEYLDVVDVLLEGGLAGGRWAMFGDFERQAIYTQRETDGGRDIPATIRRRSPVHFSYPLRINCRNVEPIAIGLELACRLKPGYSRVLHPGQATGIDIDFYRTPWEQTILLRRYLTRHREAFTPSDIVILSPKENRSSCAGRLCGQETALGIEPLREGKTDGSRIGFATIHAFKGMEASAVVLTDIERISGDKAEALLYVGMSRARLRLVILMHEDCRAAYLQAINEGFAIRAKKGGQDGIS